MFVTSADYAEQLKELDATLRNIETVLDLDRMRREKAQLEEQASAPGLWDDQAAAQQVTSRLSFVQGEITKVERLRARLDDAVRTARSRPNGERRCRDRRGRHRDHRPPQRDR